MPSKLLVRSLRHTFKANLKTANKKQSLEVILLIIAGLFTTSGALAAGISTNMSAISLEEILQATSNNHPSLRATRGLNEASARDVDAARRLRWPELSLIAETDRNKDTGNAGTRVARIQQNLWDFGRVSAIVSEAQSKVELTSQQIRTREQELHIQIVGAWQQMRASTLRLQYAKEHTALLQTYLGQMQRRVDALASPGIDLELVQSRVWQAQVELKIAESQLEQSIFLLEELSGLTALQQKLVNSEPIPTLDFFVAKQQALNTFDWPSAALSHPAVLSAQAEYQSANRQIDIKKAESFPQVYFRLDKPIAKTQFNNNTKESWFIGLSYSPGAGFSNAAQVQGQVLRAQAALDQVAAVQLGVVREMQTDYRDYTNALNRLESQQQSLQGAQKVLASYQRQFQVGRKSWLDLLNAARELSQSQYALADTHALLESALYRLKLRTQHTSLLGHFNHKKQH